WFFAIRASYLHRRAVGPDFVRSVGPGRLREREVTRAGCSIPSRSRLALARGYSGRLRPGRCRWRSCTAAQAGSGACSFSPGLGGAALHLLFVVSVGLGAAPTLLSLAERSHVRLAISIGAVVFGVASASRPLLRARTWVERTGDLAQGAAAME